MATTQKLTNPDLDVAQLSGDEFDAHLGWLAREVYRREPVEITFPADFEPPF